MACLVGASVNNGMIYEGEWGLFVVVYSGGLFKCLLLGISLMSCDKI